MKKSRKLLCSQVKIGSQVKQIVSGIKGHYTAEEMVGKKVMVLVNLKPAKLAGVLSEGMLLCAEDAEGNLALMTPEKSMPAGAEIDVYKRQVLQRQHLLFAEGCAENRIFEL